ncbi:MAG: hypothetical protein IJ375_04780 [Oscillospiraceae bacterium]|nr:hypothetical protein [Oscillospiraceae bacterium]
MRKRNSWPVTVGEQIHTVRWEEHGAYYDIYVDEELAVRIMKSDCEGNSEHDIRVGDKVCQFVVYDGKPDLSVDGILQRAEAELLRSERRSRRQKLIGGAFLIIMCTWSVFAWFGFQAAGEPLFGGSAVGLIGALAFLAVGIWLVVGTLRKK